MSIKIEALQRLIERQPEENADRYEAFLFYSRLHFSERNYNKVADGTGYAYPTIISWANEHNWQERVSAIDAHNFLNDQEQRQDLMFEENKKFIQKTKTLKDRGLTVSEKMINLAEKLLDTASLIGEEIIEETIIDADGNEVAVVKTVNMKAKVSDIPRLADTGIKIARLVSELPTEIIEKRAIPSQEDISRLSDDELRALMLKNETELIERAALKVIEK